jgi:hypothetical protein
MVRSVGLIESLETRDCDERASTSMSAPKDKPVLLGKVLGVDFEFLP